MEYRLATQADCALLGHLNRQLIQDEGHRNKQTVPQLERRMAEWLAGEYSAVLFELGSQVIGYALFRIEPDEIYLRHLFIARDLRRRGLGRKAVQLLRDEIWPKDRRLTVDVLVTNVAAVSFWRAVGYKDYCLKLEILP